MSRLRQKTDTKDLDKLSRCNVQVFHSRLGSNPYIAIRLSGPNTCGGTRRMAIVYSNRNGELTGFCTGLNPDSISGRRMRLSEVPTEIVEDCVRLLVDI